MKVFADRDVCIGAGMCVMTAAMFDQDEDGIVMVDAEEVPAEEQRRVRNAISLCPSGALQLIAD
ncbi:MAG TPA: (4Fe-4S)-binding protein [Mycobacterium sp.]|jgi:ferredoxin|nr:(4Fe-4S)-binding protein [Mycobacterium sp.]